MDDVNDMNESPDIIERALSASMKRRDFLTKAAAAGAITWVTPVILSTPAHADVIGGGTATCRPDFNLVCDVFQCPGQSSMAFPGIKVVGNGPNGSLACPCTGKCTGPPQACIKITNIVTSPSQVVRVYLGGVADCKSGTNKPFVVTGTSTTACWTSLDTSQGVFIGTSPNGNNCTGNLNSFGSSFCVSFRVAVWVGNCCDNHGRQAFTCKTFDVVLGWNQSTSTVSCDGTTSACGPTGITLSSSANSLCPTTNQVPPCPQNGCATGCA